MSLLYLARKENKTGSKILKTVKTIGRTKPSSCRLDVSPASCCGGGGEGGEGERVIGIYQIRWLCILTLLRPS